MASKPQHDADFRLFTQQGRWESELPDAGSVPDSRAPSRFHNSLPGFAPTPLTPLPSVAAALGVRSALIKDESSRAGLPSFKVLGASWAAARSISRTWLPAYDPPPATLPALRQAIAELPPRHRTLVAATDGNHGRAVARTAKLLGLEAHIVVPTGLASARVSALRAEDAQVTVVDGDYDDAVAQSATLGDADSLVVSDTSWPGYELTPADVIDGYSTLFYEVTDAVTRGEAAQPTHIVLQAGVGAFAAAGLRHFAAQPLRGIIVEPLNANCLMASAQRREITYVPGPHTSSMQGLNCGRPSPVAWPIIARLADHFIAISDAPLIDAISFLASAGIPAGESGAAGLAGLLAAAAHNRHGELGLDPESVVLIVNTEGVTDPVNYRRLIDAAT